MMSLTFGLFTQVSGSGPLGPLVTKGNNLGDFLFESLDNKVLPKWGLLLKRRFSAKGSKFFS